MALHTKSHRAQRRKEVKSIIKKIKTILSPDTKPRKPRSTNKNINKQLRELEKEGL